MVRALMYLSRTLLLNGLLWWLAVGVCRLPVVGRWLVSAVLMCVMALVGVALVLSPVAPRAPTAFSR